MSLLTRFRGVSGRHDLLPPHDDSVKAVGYSTVIAPAHLQRLQGDTHDQENHRDLRAGPRGPVHRACRSQRLLRSRRIRHGQWHDHAGRHQHGRLHRRILPARRDGLVHADR
ncbi:hypothetical protein PLANTIT3_90176 [Plantibacter sp. T3]|nr:hypothetical protein PLANTIT3_90176 [Plantibacter sp. T3]